MRFGVYQHYKGGRYLVIGVAKHTETNELMVVYVPLYPVEGCPMSVRPLAMFNENVIVKGREVPRFRYAEDIKGANEDDLTDEALTDLVMLAGYEAPDPFMLFGLTEEDRQNIADWAAAVHLKASDNDEVEVPPMPSFISNLRPV